MPDWFVVLVGEAMAPTLWVVFIAVIVCLLAVVVITLARRVVGFQNAVGGRGRAPRLSVVDMARIGDRRHLVLVRRDEVEHLLLIGGQNDLLVEPNILRVPAVARARADRNGIHAASEPADFNEPAPVMTVSPLPDVSDILRRTHKPSATQPEKPTSAPIAAAAPRPVPVVEPDRSSPRIDPPAPKPAVKTEPADKTETKRVEAAQGSAALRAEINRSPSGDGTAAEAKTAPSQPVVSGDGDGEAKKPLSVRSFVTAIQERQKAAAPARMEPASVAPASPTPQRVERQNPTSLDAVVVDDAGQAAATERSEGPAVEPSPVPNAPSPEPVGTPHEQKSAPVDPVEPAFEPVRVEPEPSPAVNPEAVTTGTKSAAPAAPAVTVGEPEPASPAKSREASRRTSLEEEMRQLLGEFSFGKDDRVGR